MILFEDMIEDPLLSTPFPFCPKVHRGPIRPEAQPGREDDVLWQAAHVVGDGAHHAAVVKNRQLGDRLPAQTGLPAAVLPEVPHLPERRRRSIYQRAQTAGLGAVAHAEDLHQAEVWGGVSGVSRCQEPEASAHEERELPGRLPAADSLQQSVGFGGRGGAAGVGLGEEFGSSSSSSSSQ